MDIQEKKVFDAYFKEKYPELYKDVFDEDGDDRAIIGYSFAWSAWQAAKSQAVPEGFVLVDKHQLAQLMANMDSFGKKALGDDYVSFADIAEVLDEAQEQSHE